MNRRIKLEWDIGKKRRQSRVRQHRRRRRKRKWIAHHLEVCKQFDCGCCCSCSWRYCRSKIKRVIPPVVVLVCYLRHCCYSLHSCPLVYQDNPWRERRIDVHRSSTSFIEAIIRKNKEMLMKWGKQKEKDGSAVCIRWTEIEEISAHAYPYTIIGRQYILSRSAIRLWNRWEKWNEISQGNAFLPTNCHVLSLHHFYLPIVNHQFLNAE